MKSLLHALLVGLLALWIAVPGVGGEGGGGENAGGTGVWILPTSAPLGAPSPSAGQSFGIDSFGESLKLRASAECGTLVATATDSYSNMPVALQVSGHDVILSSTLLTDYKQNGISQVDILIVDENQRGYRIKLMIDCVNNTGTLTVN